MVTDCDGTHLAKGMCAKHYQRWKKFGDPNADHTRKRGVCSIDGCESVTEAKGLCNKHYQRLRNFGDPLQERKRPRVPCSVDGCDRKPLARGLCPGHYNRHINGRPLEAKPLRRYVRTDDLAVRLREYAPPGAPDECWEWTAATNKGYGMISVERSKMRLAHDVAWEVHHGRLLPDGMLIRHSCDNPLCVNPSHLLLGTHSDNTADKVDRERQARGSGHGIAKLTEADIPIIREMYRSGFYQKVIAEQFGVTQGAISQLLNGKTWSHIS